MSAPRFLRRLMLPALLLWAAAAPFLGPAHAILHGSAHVHGDGGHHPGSEQCPEAPDGAEADDPCVECLATPLLTFAAPPPASQAAPRTYLRAPQAAPPAAAPHFGLGARAPPAART